MALPYKPLDRRSRLAIAFWLSLCVHALVLPFVAKDAVFKLPAQMKRTAVSLLSPRSTGRNDPTAAGRNPSAPTVAQQGAKPPKPEKEKTEEEKRKDEELARLSGQLVSLGQPKDERPPTEPTKYLSEKDSRVLKETRARETSAFFKNALSKVQKEGKNERREVIAKIDPLQKIEPPRGDAPRGTNTGGKAPQASRTQELPDRERQDRLQIQRGPDGTVRNRDAADAIAGGGRRLALARPELSPTPQLGGQGPGAPGATQGMPGAQGLPLKLTLDHPFDSLGPVAGGPMPDDLKGVEEGEETLLNSRSFKFAGYLNRVKETVGRIWSSDVQEASTRRDPTGQLYTYKDRRTVVEFTLDRAGEIRDVKVSSSSGVEYLDRVAVEAFKKAERFPNPPSGLVGDGGVVTLPFAFTLLAATGGMKIQVGPAYLPGSPASRGW